MMGQSYAPLANALGDPSLTWVPPIEQTVNGALIAPFVPSGSTDLSSHHALIVTPTATRTQTTLTIGTAAPASLSGGTWTAGAGGGAYSFYSLELTNPSASYYFSNPAGLTVIGYGVGANESYSYMAGASARSLDAAFYINNTHFQDLDGGAVCGGQQALTFRAAFQNVINTTPGYLKWFIDGTEELAARDEEEWSRTLAPGVYLIQMEVLDLSMVDQKRTLEATIAVAPALIDAAPVADQVLCVNTPVAASHFTSSESVVTFKWTNSNPTIGLPSSGTGDQPAFTAIRSGNATITVTPHYLNCEGAPQSYAIKVSPCVVPVNPHLRSHVTN
jgi:hypothetical protein